MSARLPGKAACNGAVSEYAESMVKLAKKAVFEQSLHKKRTTTKQDLEPRALYVRTNAGKNISFLS
jgi:hypothetical protein